MFGGLRKKLEELTAQANPFDGGKTAATVRAARTNPAPARTVKATQPARPMSTQQRVDQSYGAGFGGVKNRLRDVFDANTEADKIKRYSATGLAESFAQEQARKTQAAQNDPTQRSTVQQITGNALGGLSEFAKLPSQAMKMKGNIENSTLGKVATFANPTTQASAIGDELWKRATGQDTAKKRNDLYAKVGGSTEEAINNKIQQSGLGNRNTDNRIVAGVSRAGGQLLGQVAGTVASGGSTLPSAAMGLQTASSQYDQARKAGKSNDYAVNTGIAQGVVSGALEKVGFDKLGGAGNRLVSAVKGFGTEGVQEGVQQLAQNLITNRTYNPNQGIKEGVAESALIGGITGGVAGPLMGRPTKPTTSLVAPKPEPTRTRLRPEEARIWSDYQETLYKGNRMPAQVVNETHNKARQIADSLGVDIITGSPDEIAGRMNPLLEQSMAFQKEPTTSLVRPKPLNQSGYIQLPGGKDTQLNDTELGVVNYLNNKPIQEGSATQGEGNALPTELSAGKRQSYLDKMKKMVTPLNDGGYISLGAPEPKKLPQDIKNQFASQGSFGREAIDRIEANKMSKGDLERAGVIFDPKQVKKIAQTLPEFKANPVMTYRKGVYSYTDAGYGRYPVPEKARSGVFEFKHSRGTMRLNPEALFGKEMAQKLAQTAKDGEQVDFTDTMKASGNRLFTYDQTPDKPTPTVAKPVQKQVTEKQNSVDPLESLKQEARKYKSAEEFVKAQGEPLYHRSPNMFDKFDMSKVSNDTNRQNGGWGLYFSDAEPSNQAYGNYLYEVRVPKDTLLESGSPVSESVVSKIVDAVKRDNRNPNELNEFSHNGWLFYKTLGRILGSDKKASLFLARNGVDGLKMNRGSNFNDYILFDDKSIKTKQQLTDLYNQATAPQVGKTDPVEALKAEARKQAQQTEALKKQGKIKPTDQNYWTTPVKGQPRTPIPTKLDTNGVQIKEGDVIEFYGASPDGKKGRSTIRWSEPQIANASGDYIDGQWLGNGTLDNNIPFTIVERNGKPFTQPPKSAAKNSSSAKRLVEALNMNDDITQAAAQAQQDGKEFYESQGVQKVDETLPPPEVKDLPKFGKSKDKALNEAFEKASKQYLGEIKGSAVDRQATITKLNKELPLDSKEALSAIVSIDDSSIKPINDKVAKYVKKYRELTDTAYQNYTSKGVKMGFVDDYLPRIYKNPTTGENITGAEFRLLTTGSARQRGREAINLSVENLAYKNPTKLLNAYYKSLDNAVAGRNYLKNLEDNGMLTKSQTPVRGLRPIVAEGLQDPDGFTYYARPNVANKLNRMFGSQETSNLVEVVAEKGAGINSLFQSFVLSGGVPNTPINAFGIMQVIKEGMALHPVKAGKALHAGMSKGYADNVFNSKKDIIKMMAQHDIDLRVDLTQTSLTGRQRIANTDGKLNKINQAWNEFTNDSTFGRFMPMLEVLHFENVYKKAFRKHGHERAAEIAADSVKNFYGKTGNYKQTVRSKVGQDAVGTFLFAPRFRESMLNFWGKNAKAAIPTNWGKAEYRDNQKFLIAAGLSYVAMQMLNQALNGVGMEDNPDGKKDKLIIPSGKVKQFTGIDTKGKDVAVPFLPSLATVPRNAASAVYNFATGKDEEGWKNVKSFASMPVSTVMDIATNEDYFGNKIASDDATPVQKRTQQATYAVAKNMQPWIREGLNAVGQGLSKDTKKTFGIKEKSAFEALSNAGELPLRFYKPEHYRYGDNWVPKGKEGEKFTMAQQRERAKLKGEMNAIADTLGLSKKQRAEYEALNKVEFGEDGEIKQENNPFYRAQRATKLQDDGVFEAMKKKAEYNNKLNGKPIDPLYKLTPEQRRVVLWKKTLPAGTSDPTVKKLYDQDWYQQYTGEASKYYDENKAWSKSMGYKEIASDNANPFPEPSKQLQAKLDYYYTLPSGTGQRSAMLRANPDILDYWAKKDAWTNGERMKVGLGDIEDKEFSYGGGGRRGGRGGKGKASKFDYTKNLFDSGSDSASTSKQLRAILEKAMSGKS